MDKQAARVFCALWTPVDAGMKVDEPGLRAIVEFVLEQKVHGIMALGSTGDFLHLTTAQRRQVLELICKAAAQRPIIANISHVRWREAVELGRHAKDHGAKMIALLPPWFYPMAQSEVAEFFVRVTEQVGLPLAIYNFPEMTGKTVEIETIREVARRVPVAAVKQSGGDFEYHRELGRLAHELGFILLTGSDSRFPEACELGASGMVSGLSNAVPDVLMRIYDALAEGAPDRVRREREFMLKLGAKMDRLAFPLNVKAAIQARGLSTGISKSPVSSGTQARYDEFVAELRNFYHAERMF